MMIKTQYFFMKVLCYCLKKSRILFSKSRCKHNNIERCVHKMSRIRQSLGMVSMVILLCLLVFLFGFVILDGKYSVHGSDYTEYTIVGLFPLTGDLITFSESSVVSASLAAADINAWLADEGKDWRLNLEIVDTELNPDVALGLMQHWHEEEGIDFFVGPMASFVAEACLDYANENDILFISPSSNSSALAIDDWFFRFVVDEAFQNRVFAALVDQTGVQDLVFTWPDHGWGDFYQAGIAAAVADYNPTITIHDHDQFRYDPDKSDYGNEVESLNDYIADLVEQGVDPEEIGFVCIGADFEVAALMAEADNYSLLKDVVWFGTEMNDLSEDLLSHPVAAQFAADVGFIFPLQRQDLVMPEESYYEYVKEHVQAEIGREPDYYAYAANDIVCVLALSLDENGYDSTAVKETLPDITDQYTKDYGASGHIVLNEYGDRAYADFALWEVNSQLEWEEVGYYEGASGNIIWYEIPPPTQPATPVLLSPVHGKIVHGSSVELNWAPAAGATHYTVWVYNLTKAEEVIFSAPMSETSYNLDGLADNGDNYAWSVVALNANDNTAGEFATPIAFINGSDADLLPPTLASPAHSANVSGTSAEFSWEVSDGATLYSVWLFNLTTNEQVIQTVPSLETSYTFTGLANNGDLYAWSVIASDSYDWSDYAFPRLFVNE